jgi:hypothetical protein
MSMRRPLRLHLSPSFAVATVALFFALGGSAFAVREATPKPKPAPRCPLGSARAIAFVTGDPRVGIANLSDNWSSSPELFGYRYSCSGGPIEVRKSPLAYGGFDIRFPGNPGRYAVATIAADATLAVSVTPKPDGSFHVTEAGDAPSGSFPFRPTGSFVIVLF